MKVKIFAATSLIAMLAYTASAKAENLEHFNQMMATKQCQKCDLSSSGLVFADLTRFNLSNSDFRDANLSRANLTGANLTNVNLSGASLLGANLSGADLTGANLSGTDLNGANLTNAKLTNANLQNSDLRNAYLLNADLKGANLENTYLRGAVEIPLTAGNAANFYAWGVDEARKGNHKGAIELFNQSLTLEPTFPFSYLGRAISRSRLRDVAGAVQDSSLAEKLFTAQDNKEGVKVSQELTHTLLHPPGSDDGAGGFGGIINVIGSVLMQLILR